MIYLDYNATTPCDPAVVSAMLPYFSEKFGNAASRTHRLGWMADEAVVHARRQVADLIQADPEEIIFTSGATEACNLALKGRYEAYRKKGRNHIITCQTEHNAVLDSCRHLEENGAQVTYLGVDRNGCVDPDELEQAITEQTILIAIMSANNETGAMQPIGTIGAIAKKHKVAFFTDATQAVGKIPVNVLEQDIDLLSLSAHKIYGPKGVGALYVRRRRPRMLLKPQIDGGHQERNLRSGTLNVTGIVGLGTACALMEQHGAAESARLQSLRDMLEQGLSAAMPVQINAAGAQRLPHVSNFFVPGIRGAQWLQLLRSKIAFSLGSACTSAIDGPSHVLTAMGLSPGQVAGSLRLSLGRMTTEAAIHTTLQAFTEGYEQLKSNK